MLTNIWKRQTLPHRTAWMQFGQLHRHRNASSAHLCLMLNTTIPIFRLKFVTRIQNAIRVRLTASKRTNGTAMIVDGTWVHVRHYGLRRSYSTEKYYHINYRYKPDECYQRCKFVIRGLRSTNSWWHHRYHPAHKPFRPVKTTATGQWPLRPQPNAELDRWRKKGGKV